MTGREWIGLYGTMLKVFVVVVLITVGMLALWGMQMHLVEMVALALGATPIEARGWGDFGTVPTALELLAVIFGIGYLEECGGVSGLVGRISGFVHVRTCREAAHGCRLCAAMAIRKSRRHDAPLVHGRVEYSR